MCGICGIINLNGDVPDALKLKPMLKAMRHRGPNDEGTFIEENVALGFVRLSIIDLSSDGHQPMFSDDCRYVMVFNGEIYNYIELRKELEENGIIFHTKTDTEVLLKSYIYWGEKCLHKFNGMWAFVIYDRLKKDTFVSRDRYGVKPFYYCYHDNKLIFGSEIPVILEAIDFKIKPNEQMIFDYLIFNRTDHTEFTFFDKIKKLQHGHCLLLNDNKLSIKKWYNLKDNIKDPFQSSEEYKKCFTKAVGLRLRSDVPVGVCLSGGLDSSSIVSTLISEYNKYDLNTFSAVYKHGQIGDESAFINIYKTILTNMFFTTPSVESLIHDMHYFIKAHAEPISSTSPYAQYKVMELAKNKVVVTLDGQGADEQLGGYHYFFSLFFKELLLNWKLGLLGKELAAYLHEHKSLFAIKSFAYFVLPEKLRLMGKVTEKGYLNSHFINRYKKESTVVGSLYTSSTLQEAFINHFEYKLEHLLKWEDRNSMFFSLEARTPFLDYNLVERTLALPSTNIIKNGITKHILREAMKGILPEKIRVRRDKIGFSTPQDEWFRTPQFQAIILEIINSASFNSRGFFNVARIKELYERHLLKKINCSNEIWKWIHLEMWFRQFID